MRIPKLTFLFLLILFLTGTALQVTGQTTVFADDFSTLTSNIYTTSGAINGSSWNVTRSGDDWGAIRSSTTNQLELTNSTMGGTTSSGWILASVNTSSFASPYKSQLNSNPGLVSWTFNMRQIRPDPGGFSSGAYGVAFMLAGSSTDPRSNGNGYAVLVGSSSGDGADSIRLVSFTGGLNTGGSNKIANLVRSNTATNLRNVSNSYLSIKVTYNPYTNTWELFARSDGATNFADPSTGTLVTQGTAVDNSYTSTSLPYLGAYWQGATLSNQTAFFDNIKVTVTGVPAMNVTGNGNTIANGSTTTSLSNNTDFGYAVVSTGSATQTFTILNTGSATLNLTGSSPYISLSGANASDFSVVSVPSNSISALDSTHFQIRFVPSALGTRSATISIANNTAYQNPYTFAIQGTSVLYVTSATDYFRSRQSGNWSSLSTWESSNDNITWYAATAIPTSSAKGILIQTGFPATVSDGNETMNNVTVNDGLILSGRPTKLTLPANGVMNINNGGMLKFSQTKDDYSLLVNLGIGSIITINSGGVISVSSTSGIDMGNIASDATGTFVWKTNSVFEWNYGVAFATANVTYFPKANATTIPIFKVTKAAVVGANIEGGPTKIYGLFENNTDLSWNRGGIVNFRNGINGTGTINFLQGVTATIGDFAGAMVTTAQIGGAGAISKGSTGTLSVVIANLCTTTLISSKSFFSADITVNPSGVLKADGYQINGSADTLTVSGTFKTAHPDGFSGATTGSIPRSSFGSVTLNSGSTVDYTSASAQTLTANPYSNLISSSTGVKSAAGNITVGNNLTLTAGTVSIGAHTLTLNGGVTHVSGSLTGASDPALATSNLVLNGIAAEALYFTVGKYYMHNVTIGSNATNVSLDDSLYITGGASFGTLTVNGKLNTNGYLSLKSSAGGDGVMGQSSSLSTNTITGNVTVERFIPKRRAWRFMSIPTVSSTQTINDAWQEGSLPNADVITRNDAKPSYGTEITYDNQPSHGFDVGPTTNSSLKAWSSATNTWTPVTSTFLPINNYNPGTSYTAYCLFVRGSRAVNLSQGSSAIADNTILRTTGILNTGSFSYTYATTQGNKVLVSNPFASPINILHVLTNGNNANNFSPAKFWVWDPATAGLYGVGAYITYNNGLQAPSGSAYNGDVYAQSGQAFMLEAKTTGNSAVSFAEADKATGNQTNVFGRVSSESKRKYPAIYANLMLTEGDSLSLLDGVAAGFDNRFSASADADDAGKLMNNGENIALARDSQRLAIEMRPVPVSTDTLFLKLYLKQQPYTLQLFSQALPDNLPAEGWLVDKFLGTQTEVNLYDTTLYSFTPNADTNSYRNRFMLVFNKVSHQSFTALTGEKDVAIVPTDNAGKGAISIYPNPVTGGKVNLLLSGVPKGDYNAGIYTLNGQAVYQHSIPVLQSQAVQSLTLHIDRRLAAGSYLLRVVNNTGTTVYHERILIGK